MANVSPLSSRSSVHQRIRLEAIDPSGRADFFAFLRGFCQDSRTFMVEQRPIDAYSDRFDPIELASTRFSERHPPRVTRQRNNTHQSLGIIQQQLQQNQVFSGGLLLMVGGAALAYFRQTPQNIYHFLRRKLITEIDILDRDPAF